MLADDISENDSREMDTADTTEGDLSGDATELTRLLARARCDDPSNGLPPESCGSAILTTRDRAGVPSGSSTGRVLLRLAAAAARRGLARLERSGGGGEGAKRTNDTDGRLSLMDDLASLVPLAAHRLTESRGEADGERQALGENELSDASDADSDDSGSGRPAFETVLAREPLL
eukprot:Rhum_TRINITY_DN968_c0_g1::Rhum_TRINITY_DN968_c0_g1_i1::g.2885::m.2885